MISARHNPYSKLDRFPLGACPAGSVVCLRVTVFDTPARVFARLWRGDGEELIPMNPVSSGRWETRFSVGHETGLIWYYFILEDENGERTYLGKPMGEVCGVFSHEPSSFQITVHDPAFDTPSWMRESVMMQIMPDRFYTGGRINPPHGKGAYLHKNWYELPDVCPGEALDFFGGNLLGITEKLPYLNDLGIGAIYLNPIFRARSNHKYDTGDYMEVDPSFGTEKDLITLTQKAADMGIHVVLDGVFSHTGADSRYFNRFGTYDSEGAYNAYGHSPYSSWYTFKGGRNDYECWWDFDTLPNVTETDPSYMDFILRNKDCVVAHYLRSGISGWRLDVADELPMEFIRLLRMRTKYEGKENCVIGEVWEDITNKTAYGRHRCYATGDTLDSAMNYPLRDMTIGFMMGNISAYTFEEFLRHQQSTLPRPMHYSMMNLLGSHDKPRIIDVLSGKPGAEEKKFTPLSPAEYKLGKERFLAAFDFICHLPGMPCLYYGDEAGLTGGADPFCRRTYPWGQEDRDLTERVRGIIRERNSRKELRTGECIVSALGDDRIEVRREEDGVENIFTLSRI